MKKVGLHIPIVLSLIVLGAHFLRGGSMIIVVGVLLLLALLPLRRPWIARLTQVILVIGALEWLRTLALLVMRRAAAGQPLLRMALILSAVAAVTLGSALLFQTKTLRRIYGLASSSR